MIGYACLGTNDAPRAQAFYDALLGTIGAKRLMEFPNGFTMWGFGMNQPGIAVTPPHDGNAATVGNGNMLAIPMMERAQVDAFYNKAIELGGTDEGPPGLRGPEGDQGFYAAYFRDLDGNKIGVFRVGPA